MSVAGLVTLAVVAGGIVALAVVCDLEPSCTGEIDRQFTVQPPEAEDAGLTYHVRVEANRVVGEDVAWSSEAPPERNRSRGAGAPFLLTVQKDGIPLEQGLRFHLANATGNISWDSRVSGTHVERSTVFDVTLYRGFDDPQRIHRTRIVVDR